MTGVIIVGAGGHARVVVDAIQCAGAARIRGLVDDRDSLQGTVVSGCPVIGKLNLLYDGPGACDSVVIAIGDNETRMRISNDLVTRGWRLHTVVHPSAVISRTATLGDGTMVMAGAVVQTGAITGKSVIINTGATVDHDCVLGDGAHLGPGVHLAGTVRVGGRSMLGTGAVAVPNVTIGPDCIIGAGSVVLRDVPAGTVAFGAPARARRLVK